jgi:hypothetical protein
VTTSEPRIVAVTDSTALVIGLTCAPTDWDVLCRPTTEAAPGELAEAAVLVLDLGTAAAGLDLFAAVTAARAEMGGERRRRNVDAARAVVIADDEPVGSLPDGATVLLRPFTLPQLQDAIGALLEPPRPGAPDAGDQETTTAADVADREADESGSTAGEPLATRLFGRIATTPAPDEAPPLTGEDALEDVPLPADPPANVSPPTAGQPDDELADDELADDDDPPEPARRSDHSELHGVVYLTPDLLAGPPTQRPQRWLARRQRRVPEEQGRLRERLAAVLAATAELERLIEQVPLLGSLDDLAQAIVSDLATQFEADTTALWRAIPDGWEVQAHLGLTAHEATWRVPFDHPLFGELDATGGAILIDPVDVVQATVAGIGGAHTQSLMAAAIAVGPGRFGILVVGRDRPLTPRDLDHLIDLVTEAALGLAVAEQLARLRGPAVRIDLPEPEPARSWRRRP